MQIGNRQFLPVAILFTVFMMFYSVSFATSSDDIQKEAGETASAIKDYSIEQKDAAVAKAKELIEQLDDNAHTWEGRIKEKLAQLKDSSKEGYKETGEKIKQQREELAEWAKKLQTSSGDAWDEAKEGFDKAYDALMESLAKAAEELKE